MGLKRLIRMNCEEASVISERPRALHHQISQGDSGRTFKVNAPISHRDVLITSWMAAIKGSEWCLVCTAGRLSGDWVHICKTTAVRIYVKRHCVLGVPRRGNPSQLRRSERCSKAPMVVVDRIAPDRTRRP